jgi:hypothetical protein
MLLMFSIASRAAGALRPSALLADYWRELRCKMPGLHCLLEAGKKVGGV